MKFAPIRKSSPPISANRWSELGSLVIARLHIDFRLRLDAVVYDERQRITVTNGGTAPCAQIREQRIDLGFLRHFNIIAKLVPQIRDAKMMRRWQDGEHVASIAPQHDCLGQTIPRNPTLPRRYARTS